MEWQELLMFSLPSGFLGGVVGWFTSRIKRKTDSTTILLNALNRQNNEIAKIYYEMGIIRRATERRNDCRYLSVCPVDVELQKSKNDRIAHIGNDGQPGGTEGNTYPGTECTPQPGRPPP